MTNPVILLGTQSNGETLPVQVDATGRLVAEGLPGEQGEQGPQGPQGPQGEKGDDGDLALPDNPQEGQLLGWQNGELAWITQTTAFELQYLVIAGGGAASTPSVGSYIAGGGAGGYISGVRGERSGGGMNSAGPLSLELTGGGLAFDVLAGGPGQDSVFSSPTWNFQAKAGGTWDFNDGVGGSGAGGAQFSSGEAGGPGAAGTPEQGFNGSAGAPWQASNCQSSNFYCHYVCVSYNGGRGGGGAGGAGSNQYGGAGVTSSITGTPVIYAAGGRGRSMCSTQMPDTDGFENYGSGGTDSYEAKPGAVIFKYPSYVSLRFRDGATASMDVVDLGDYSVATITGGYGLVMAEFKPGFFINKLRDNRTPKRAQKGLNS